MSFIEFTGKKKEKRYLTSYAWLNNGCFAWTCPICKNTHLDSFAGIFNSLDADGDLPVICSCNYKSFVNFKYLIRYGKG